MEVVKGVERWKVIKHILTQAEKGDYSIYTSTITLAEVHKLRSQPAQDSQVSQRILAFFEHEYIKLIDVDRRVGEQANEFCRKFGLHPADAIHLACALRAGCDALLAWDNRFVKANHPQISMEALRMLGQHALDIPLDDKS